MSVSPTASLETSRGLADSTNSEVPWEDVERSLSDWLAAIRAATASGKAKKVGCISLALCRLWAFQPAFCYTSANMVVDDMCTVKYGFPKP